MEVLPFKADHLKLLKLQEMQLYLSGWVTHEQGLALEGTPSYTAVINGVPVAAAGIIPQWQGRAMAWAFLSEIGPRQFLGVHRAVRGFLDGCYIRRIEMTVNTDFPAAHRWAKMLGFSMEAECMAGYLPDGGDCALYARVL